MRRKNVKIGEVSLWSPDKTAKKKKADLVKEFWNDIVFNKNGTLNKAQVMKELGDYMFLLEQVPKVYGHITGGKLSKVMHRAETIIAHADDLISKNYVDKDDLRQLLE